MMYADSKYIDPLGLGETYQRFIAEVFKRKFGVTINYYTRKVDQYLIGESKEGYEIKLDTWIEKSKRLSIEIAEKTRISLTDFTPSGIFRKDNTKWYVQGDWKTAWIFRKETLQKFFHDVRPEVIDNKPPTIKKFYISIEVADRLAIRKVSLDLDAERTQS